MRKSKIILLVPAFCFVLSGAHANAIDNFGKVSKEIFRGARPNSAGLAELQALGIKTIINLEDNPRVASEERLEAEALGITEIMIPMSGLAMPTDDQVDRAISAIKNPTNQPVFLHCLHGADRSGVVIGVYRVEQQGWSSQSAWEEMNLFGFSKFQVLMKKYFEKRTGYQE